MVGLAAMFAVIANRYGLGFLSPRPLEGEQLNESQSNDRRQDNVLAGDIIERVALLIRYGTIRMA